MIHTTQPSLPIELPNPGSLLHRAFAVNRWLTIYALLATALLAVTIVLAFVDQRLVTGMPVWIKPMKFASSLAINSFTLLWLLHFVQGRRRWVALAANTVAVASLVEIAAIVGQAARGVGSHFNVATALDGLIFSLMGLFVNFLWGGMLAVAVLIMLQRFQHPAFAWSLRLGMAITLTASVVTGVLMLTQPGIVDATTGQTLYSGAHSVGVADGGPGLPLLGWSTEGGDLRPAHFFGLHAIQILALLGGMLSARRWSWLRRGHRTALVWLAALGYAGFVALVTWQALRAEPLVAPSALTLLGLTGIITAVAMGTGSVLWHAKSSRA